MEKNKTRIYLQDPAPLFSIYIIFEARDKRQYAKTTRSRNPPTFSSTSSSDSRKKFVESSPPAPT